MHSNREETQENLPPKQTQNEKSYAKIRFQLIGEIQAKLEASQSSASSYPSIYPVNFDSFPPSPPSPPSSSSSSFSSSSSPLFCFPVSLKSLENSPLYRRTLEIQTNAKAGSLLPDGKTIETREKQHNEKVRISFDVDRTLVRFMMETALYIYNSNGTLKEAYQGFEKEIHHLILSFFHNFPKLQKLFLKIHQHKKQGVELFVDVTTLGYEIQPYTLDRTKRAKLYCDGKQALELLFKHLLEESLGDKWKEALPDYLQTNDQHAPIICNDQQYESLKAKINVELPAELKKIFQECITKVGNEITGVNYDQLFEKSLTLFNKIKKLEEEIHDIGKRYSYDPDEQDAEKCANPKDEMHQKANEICQQKDSKDAKDAKSDSDVLMADSTQPQVVAMEDNAKRLIVVVEDDEDNAKRTAYSQPHTISVLATDLRRWEYAHIAMCYPPEQAAQFIRNQGGTCFLSFEEEQKISTLSMIQVREYANHLNFKLNDFVRLAIEKAEKGDLASFINWLNLILESIHDKPNMAVFSALHELLKNPTVVNVLKNGINGQKITLDYLLKNTANLNLYNFSKFFTGVIKDPSFIQEAARSSTIENIIQYTWDERDHYSIPSLLEYLYQFCHIPANLSVTNLFRMVYGKNYPESPRKRITSSLSRIIAASPHSKLQTELLEYATSPSMQDPFEFSGIPPFFYKQWLFHLPFTHVDVSGSLKKLKQAVETIENEMKVPYQPKSQEKIQKNPITNKRNEISPAIRAIQDLCQMSPIPSADKIPLFLNTFKKIIAYLEEKYVKQNSTNDQKMESSKQSYFKSKKKHTPHHPVTIYLFKFASLIRPDELNELLFVLQPLLNSDSSLVDDILNTPPQSILALKEKANKLLTEKLKNEDSPKLLEEFCKGFEKKDVPPEKIQIIRAQALTVAEISEKLLSYSYSDLQKFIQEKQKTFGPQTDISKIDLEFVAAIRIAYWRKIGFCPSMLQMLDMLLSFTALSQSKGAGLDVAPGQGKTTINAMTAAYLASINRAKGEQTASGTTHDVLKQTQFADLTPFYELLNLKAAYYSRGSNWKSADIIHVLLEDLCNIYFEDLKAFKNLSALVMDEMDTIADLLEMCIVQCTDIPRYKNSLLIAAWKKMEEAHPETTPHTVMTDNEDDFDYNHYGKTMSDFLKEREASADLMPELTNSWKMAKYNLELDRDYIKLIIPSGPERGQTLIVPIRRFTDEKSLVHFSNAVMPFLYLKEGLSPPTAYMQSFCMYYYQALLSLDIRMGSAGTLKSKEIREFFQDVFGIECHQTPRRFPSELKEHPPRSSRKLGKTY